MTLTLNLSPETAARLSRHVETAGKPAETVVAEMIETLPEEAAPPTRRTLGRYFGQLWMSEDFNDELPDSFWFPYEFTDKEATAK